MNGEEQPEPQAVRAPAEPDPKRADEARWSEWMAAAQQGDEAAYRQLLEDILPAVRGWVRAKLFDPNAVEDVVQNALLNVHRARHTYRADRPFAPWLRVVVRNAIVDSLREGGRRREREVATESFEHVVGTHPSESAIEKDELSSELAQALAELPAKQREAVELIHIEGLSVAAAALRAGVKPGALKVRAHRGYRALRARLGAPPS